MEYTGMFPVLNEDEGNPCTTTEEISGELLERARLFVSAKGCDLVIFLQTIWAIALQQYADTDFPSYIFCHTRDTKSGLQVFQLSIDSEDSIQGLWKRIEQQDCLHGSPFHQTTQNTGLLISVAAPTSDPTVLLDEFRRLQEGGQRCQALLVLEGDSQSPYRLAFISNTALLSSHQATNVASTISQLILEALEGCDQTVGQLNLFSPLSRQYILEWNYSQGLLGTSKPSIIEAIRAKVKEQPDATAICSPDGDLTYAELETASTQLAIYLRGQGVGPDVLVPLLFHRCQWVVVAQLAVLKAGGAFVPLEPSYPNARLTNIIGRTKCGFLLTSEALVDRGSMLAERVLCIGHTLMSDLPNDYDNRHRPLYSPKPDSPAYVLFTSGSTGQPKGCVIEHQAMAQIPNQAAVPSMGLSPNSRVLQFASYAFAISIVEIYHALSSGATICIPSEHDRVNNLTSVIVEMKITWSFITPSLLRNLDLPKKHSTLQTILLSGEPVHKGEFDDWAAAVDLVHVYGASEACGPVGFKNHQSNTIAFLPSPMMRFWLVDAVNHHKLAPVGITGELVLEGPSIARGYLDNHLSTSSMFIEPPSWRHSMGLPDIAPSHLYKTGDLFRYGEDGSIHYVRRKGTEVKIRGKRFDLAEVEFHVRHCCPDVARVIALTAVPADANGVPSLFVFLHSPRYMSEQKESSEVFFASSFESFQSEALSAQAKLEEILPDHMLPSFYIPLGYIPMTVSGKVDTRALRHSLQKSTRRELGVYQSHGSVEVVQPASDLERDLHSVFAEVLGVDSSSFGVNHSFIHLGGDSLAAMQMVKLCRSRKYHAVTVAEILGQQTISKLTQHLATTKGTESTIIPPPPFSLLPGADQIDMHSRIAFTAEQCRVPFAAVQDVYPCTALQQGVMISSIKVQDRFIARCVFDLIGGLDIERLKAAWQMTVDANDTLRTRIVQSPSGEMIQTVLRQDQSVIQWGRYPSTEAYQGKDKALFMGLGDPLARFSFIEDPSSESGVSLALTLHHAIFDVHSLGLLLEQVEKAYSGETLEPNIFSPFIQAIQRQDSSAQEAFWKATFADLRAPVFPSLPHEMAVPKATAHLEQTACLPPQTGSGITLSNIARLAWAIVVANHTDSEDVVFGVTVTGRATPTPGIEEMTGPTIATVPFRVRCHQEDTVADTLETVQSLAIRMIAFEQTGVQNIRQISAEAARACDFQSQLIFQQPESTHSDQDRPIMKSKRGLYGLEDFGVFINYAIGLVCTPSSRNQSLHISAHFDHNILPTDLAKRLVTQFSNILQQLCAGQNQRIRQLDLVSPQELEVMKKWNGASLPVEDLHTLHELILQNAQREPLAPAVSSWDQQVTYHGLEALSTEVGKRIIQAGVKPGDRLALCFEKSIWSVVSMLAVLRAGAAAINIDPSLPPARIAAILQVAEPAMALSSPETHAIVQSLHSGLPLLQIPSRNPTTVAETETTTTIEWPSVMPHDVAFMLFTSGTTGTPKAIVIEHRNLTTAFYHHREALGAYPGMRSLHFCSYAWDMSLQEIFFTWVYGGCLCIPSETQRMSNLADFIREHRVNWAVMTPSALTILTPDEVPGLTTLVLTGENVPIKLMEMWSSRLQMINAYGPAEAFTSAYGRIKPDLHCVGRIGPMLGAAGWVTLPGDVSRLAPLGAIGELLLEGPMVSRGYFHEPEKTRQAFIQAPAWLKKIRPGGHTGRIFRTGDLVRFDENGCLHYVSRKDTQMKLRGQRIVLGDLEHQIQLHFASAQKVVAEVIRPKHSESSLLVAFIYRGPTEENADKYQILQEPEETFFQHSASVMATLQGILPIHMIPTAIFPISRVPYGTTLKIDRGKLREAAEHLTLHQLQSYTVGGGRSSIPKEPPATSAEVMWQGLWARVLSIPADCIGRDDHLFRMGGDSLMAIKLVALAHREGLPHITFQDVLNHPRLRDIALVSTASCSVSAPSQGSSGPAPFALIEDVATLVQLASEQCGTPIDSIEDIYPCTPLQASLIADTVHHRDSYLLLQAYTLEDGVDIERLKRAWEITANAHPILRTRVMQTSTGASYQVVLGGPLDWSHLETDELNPPQPTVGLGAPLLQLILSPSRLFLFIHHTLYDGWSLPLLAREVDQVYRELPIQPIAPFNSFIAHIEGCMDSAALFWREELQDANPAHFPILPSLDYRPRPQSSINKAINLPENTTKLNVTLASKIKLAWALVSSTYAYNNDVIVGVLSSGRTAPVVGIERMLGPTIATVPQRIRLDPAKSVSDTLEKVQAQSMRQMEYEHLGLHQISQQSEHASAACQFQTLIVVEPKQPDNQSPVGEHSWFRNEEILSDVSQFSSHALMLQCQSFPGGSVIDVTVTFDPDILAPPQIRRVLSQFEYYLTQIQAISDNVTVIGDLQVLNPEDLKEITSWNPLPSPPEGDIDRCVHDLVHEQCQSRPNAPAIHAWDGDFTYEELDDHVARLASHIQTFNVVRPDTFVALYFEKSRWTVVAQLAVLRAGGAFTMLETSQPIGRIREICDTVQPPLILTSEEQQVYAAGLFDVPVLGVGQALLAHGSLCLERCSRSVKPTHAMYTISTSGTTGKPKVAVIEHRCFIANVKPIISQLGLSADSRVFQFAGYGFDAMLVEHFITLLAGGCICIPSKFDRDNRLDKAITEVSANWAMLTTSVIQLLSPASVPTIQTLVQAGEPMQQGIIDRWASHVHLMNAYGPSECTILSCINKAVLPDSNPNVIGQVTGGVTWIVDPDTLDLVPIGAEGELIIEGDIVGRGYLNDPERTAVAFIPRPNWLDHLRGEASEKPVYRTGDLVKYTPEGSICYVRRKDLQIKLRGQRLELLDVEHHVQQCFPGALQVVAAVTTFNATSSVLVALVLSSTASAPPSTDADLLLPVSEIPQFLKDVQTAEIALQERVSAYMVPSIFLPLSRIPRDINGKVDRRQINAHLASLSRQEVDSFNSSCTTLAPPENDLQRDIRAIWAVVLGIPTEEIGIHSSFFRIGGDSITSMQVVAQCRSAGISITMQDLFKHRTIEQLAAHTDRPSHGDRAEIVQPGQLDVLDKTVDLSPIQQMYFEYAPEDPNSFVQSFFLRLGRNNVDSKAVSQALHAVVEVHSILRARFKKSLDGTWTQSIPTTTEGSSYRYHDRGVQSQQMIESICRASRQSLDIEHGPLLIVDQFERDDDGTHWLYLVAHHLVIDLVSWRVIFADLEHMLTTGSVPKVPPTSFLQWCQLQADYATRCLPVIQKEDDQRATAYWGDGVANYNTHRDADTYIFSLDQETSQILLNSANDALNTQPVELIHAAVLHSFVQLFPDRPAPVVFSEGHGREPWDATIDLSRTVGWFTTIWPTKVALQASEGIVTALRRIKDARRRTPANGWEYFTSRYLHPQGPKALKTMEILFNYQGRYQQLERADALFKFDGTNHFGAGDVAENMPRFSLLDVSARVSDDCLHMQFLVNRRMKHQDRLHQWASQCERSLREAAALLSLMRGSYPTVSDFPLLSAVHSDQLDRFMADLAPKLDSQVVEDIYPTASVQRGILMSQARNPQYYQQVVKWRVLPTHEAAGLPIDIEKLGRAWQQVVHRHSVLRTTFVEISDQGMVDQLVLKHASAEAQFDSGSPECNDDRIRPSPQLHLERSAQGDITLELHINHALFDGHSERILRRDLVLAYEDNLPHFPAPSYRDYIAYLYSTNVSGDDNEAYWRSYLDSPTPCLFPRLVEDAGTDDQEYEEKEDFGSFYFDLGSTTDVEEFCEEHRVALTSVYHVVWAIVLSCYSGVADVCFGYMTSGRSAPVSGIEDIVGPIINTLIGKLQFPPQALLVSVLQQYHDDLLRSLSHQHHSLGETLHAIGATNGELFNTAISVQDRRKEVVGSQPLSSIALVDAGMEDRSEFPVTLNIAVFEKTSTLLVSYQTAFLAPKYAMAIGDTFAHVLSEVLSHPSRAICEIELLNSAQRTGIELRNRLVPEAVKTLVHHVIHQRCLEQPDAQAVCAWDGSFTFEELDRLSSILAEELINHGVSIEMPIPVYTEKTRWTPVAILGILKAGATFVLLDASYPSARLRTICDDTEASLVLASPSLLSKATDLTSRVIEVGDRLLTYSVDTVRWPALNLSEGNAAYVVFTSGSTGKPKGIVITHSSLSTSLQSLVSRCDINSASRMLQFASHAFDASILDILLPLLAGGCVCIPSDEERTGDITNAMNRMSVNCALTTSTVARLFNPDDLPLLKTLILGGEAVSAADLTMWHGKVRIIGAYGPAECSIVSTLNDSMTKSSNPRNIGYGSGCVLWVVDRNNYYQLAPDGVVGELLVEGPIVARGYLNNEQQSALAFVEPPSWLVALRKGGPPVRLYKTGDLVRYAGDGSLIFVGRKDDQVKIRGQRLELGEVESQVARAFKESRVLVELVGNSGSPFLVAYVLQGSMEETSSNSTDTLLHPPSGPFSDSVRVAVSLLQKALPSYMVPSAFLPLAQLPKGITGKTDRKRLREHAASLSQKELESYSVSTTSRRVPCTPLEARLQRLVAQALNRPSDSIPLEEDMFQVGMDSMKAMSLVAAGRRDGVHLSVQMLFQHPRLSGLAVALGEKEEGDNNPLAPSPLLDFADEICAKWNLDRGDVVNIVPATYYQRGSIETHHLAHITTHFSQPLDKARLSRAFSTTMERHSVLRTVFVPFQKTFVQVVLRHINLTVEEIDTDEDPKEAVQSICRTDAMKPIPFGKPTLHLFMITGRDRLSVSLRMNHAHYDGMSVFLMLEEVAALYAGSMSPPPSGLDYPDFIAHRAQRATPAAFQFWRDLLQDSSMTHLIPNGDAMGRPERSRLDLLAISSDEIPMPDVQDGITMATVVKAAWALCLAQYTHSEDVVFGQISTNRALAIDGVDRTVGPGVNYIPVRVTLQSDWTAKELFHWVQGQHIRGMSYDTVDWDEIVARSTSWPQDTPVGTGLHYLNAPPLWDNDYLFAGDIPARNQHIDFKMLHNYPMIMCVPIPAKGNGTDTLGMTLSSPIFSQDVANELLSLFRETVIRLTTYPENLVWPAKH